MPEEWPDAQALYKRPANSSENKARWQAALDASLASGRLKWLKSSDPDTFTLSGECPRCGHDTEQEVETAWIQDAVDAAPAALDDRFLGEGDDDGRVRFNFDCACGKKHSDGSKEHEDCGWGGPLAVETEKPRIGRK